jgi:hypothetical protein
MDTVHTTLCVSPRSGLDWGLSILLLEGMAGGQDPYSIAASVQKAITVSPSPSKFLTFWWYTKNGTLHCLPSIVAFAGYVSVCVQLYCVGFHRLSLHVSAYMVIFKCVGYFYFHMLEGFCFAAFFSAFFTWSHSACFPFVFCSCAVFLLYFCCFLACVFVCLRFILYIWRWPCRPKHVVKDSENQHNKAAGRRKHNLQKPC